MVLMTGPTIDSGTAAQLAEAYCRNGYVRYQNSERLAELGSQRYKKGDEIRLVARDEAELDRFRELLVTAGFRPGKAYFQDTGWRQPIYGRMQVEEFLEMVAGVRPGM